MSILLIMLALSGAALALGRWGGIQFHSNPKIVEMGTAKQTALAGVVFFAGFLLAAVLPVAGLPIMAFASGWVSSTNAWPFMVAAFVALVGFGLALALVTKEKQSADLNGLKAAIDQARRRRKAS